MKIFHSGRVLLTAFLSLAALLPNWVFAYGVEEDSVGNTIYVLLMNDNPGAVYHSITLTDTAPAFVTDLTATIVPETVNGGSSDLAAVAFNVIPGAVLGATSDIVLTVSGFAAGTTISFDVTVPLEVVSSSDPAQGFVGLTIPAPDPGGVDSDGDGVTDALETAFGSDPLLAESIPGTEVILAEAYAPILPPLALAFLALVFATVGISISKQRAAKGEQA